MVIGVGTGLAISAGLGLASSVLGENSGPSSYADATQTIVNELPSYLRGPTSRLAQSAESLVANDPYQPYQGQRIASLTPDHISGFNTARDASGIGAMRVGSGYEMASQAGAPVGGQDINRLFNPYLSLVGQQAERELSRQNLQQRNVDGARAVQAGAFGGARHGIVDAERERNHTRGLSDLYERLYAGGYDRALSGAQTDKARGLQSGIAQGQLGVQGQQTAFQDTAQQIGIGQLQQEQTQRNLNLGYTDFQNQRRHPYEQLEFLTQTLAGNPGARTMSTSQISSTPRYDPSALQQGLGTGIATLGALSNFGAFGQQGSGVAGLQQSPNFYLNGAPQ